MFISILALDFYVKEIIFNAINLGFRIYLILDATKSTTFNPELIREFKKLNVKYWRALILKDHFVYLLKEVYYFLLFLK